MVHVMAQVIPLMVAWVHDILSDKKKCRRIPNNAGLQVLELHVLLLVGLIGLAGCPCVGH